MQPGLVSVMMPAYNAAQYVGEAIESLLNQSYSNWELLVVDDGSTDGTAQVVREVRDPRIRLLIKENGGESTARNMALDHSRGEFIAFLDADDAYLPHHLERTVGYLESHPNRDAVYTDGVHIDQSGRRLASLQSRRRGPFEGRLFEEAVLASDLFGPPLCVVLRHDRAVQELRYDPRIVIGPDWDFFVRYTDHARFGYLPEQTCLYRVHSSNITAQVDGRRRAGYLALCREKAIRMESFRGVSTETASAVFYDLLINLLGNEPERQAAVTGWPEFLLLPETEQGRLLRIMAAKAIAKGRADDYVASWLARAAELNPADVRAEWLRRVYNVSPRLCGLLLRARTSFHGAPADQAPFADLAMQGRPWGGRRSASGERPPGPAGAARM